VVDDGSKDETAGIAAKYREKVGDKMILVRQENRGLPAARNTAIRAGSSELLALLDSDDVWLPNRLEESVNAMAKSENIGLSYGRITRIDPEGNLLDNPAISGREGRIAPGIYTREVHLPCPTVTFRRKFVEQVGTFDEAMRATEDRDLWFRIAQVSETAYIPKVLAYYRISANQMSSDPARMLAAQLQFLKKHYGEPGCGWSTWRKGASTINREAAEGYWRQGEVRQSLTYALRALALNPLDRRNLRAILGSVFEKSKRGSPQ
jgi:glycosyltransferase involved in cell wall biosynthesis